MKVILGSELISAVQLAVWKNHSSSCRISSIRTCYCVGQYRQIDDKYFCTRPMTLSSVVCIIEFLLSYHPFLECSESVVLKSSSISLLSRLDEYDGFTYFSVGCLFTSSNPRLFEQPVFWAKWSPRGRAHHMVTAWPMQDWWQLFCIISRSGLYILSVSTRVFQDSWDEYIVYYVYSNLWLGEHRHTSY